MERETGMSNVHNLLDLTHYIPNRPKSCIFYPAGLYEFGTVILNLPKAMTL